MADIPMVRVVDRLGLFVPDGSDPDLYPEPQWCDEGTVRFTPLNTYVKVVDGVPVPFSAGESVFDVPINSDGFLTWQGANFVWFYDLTSDEVNPTIGDGKATHSVEFKNVKSQGTTVSFPSTKVRLATDTLSGLTADQAAAFGLPADAMVCYLTKLTPVPAAGGTPITRGVAGVGVAALAVADGSLAYTLTDGTEGDAGVLPVGPGGSDEGVAGYVADPDSETTAALTGAFVTQLGPSNGTDDTAWLNAKLAVGGAFIGMAGQSYKISSSLIIPSSTSLDMGGCTIAAIAGFVGPMGANTAAAKMTAGTYDAFAYINAAAGATVLNTSGVTGAFVVGQGIVIDGAGGDSNVPHAAYITAISGTQITISTPIVTAVSGRGAHAYAMDHDISVTGGRWERGGFGTGGSSQSRHGLRFRFVRRLRADIDYYGSTTSDGKYAISAAAVWDYSLGIGDANTTLDGIHIMGPAYSGVITRLHGTFGDDGLSLTAADYTGGLADTSGDIVGLLWDLVDVDSDQSCVKIMSGPGRLVDQVQGGLVRGTYNQKYGVYLGEDTLNVGTTGGSWGDIDFGTIGAKPLSTGNLNARLYLGSPNAATVKGKVIARGMPSGKTAVLGGGSTAATIGLLDLTYDASGPGTMLDLQAGNISTTKLALSGQYTQNSGTGSPVLLGVGTHPDVVDRVKATLTAKKLVAVSGTASGMLRQPQTITPPGCALTTAAAAWVGANRAVFMRFSLTEATVIRYLNWLVGTSSGNVQYGLVKLSGSGFATATIIFTSGTIACPASGGQHSDLGAQRLEPGEYAVFFWADNITFTTSCGNAASLSPLRLAASMGDLTAGVGAVGDTQTLSWADRHFTCSLENA